MSLITLSVYGSLSLVVHEISAIMQTKFTLPSLSHSTNHLLPLFRIILLRTLQFLIPFEMKICFRKVC